MRLLIVFTRPTGADDMNFTYHMPLGLMYISSMLKHTGHRVDVLNLNHRRGKAADIIRNVLDEADKYDYVCTGGLSTHYLPIKEVVETVRGHRSGAGIILGGGLISSEPELMLDALKPDFIVIGEGENTIVELLSSIENKADLSDVAGIGFRDGNGRSIITKPRLAINDLDSLPLPDYDGFELETYLDNINPSDSAMFDLYDNPRAYPLICSRSCPFQCTFCYHPVGNKYRQRSLDAIMRELETAVKRYKINIVVCYDELFSYDRKRVYDFCGRFRKIQNETPWEIKWFCQMRVDKIDDEFLRTMKDAGCYMVSYGFESYNPVVLKSMKKNITPAQIDNVVHLTMKNNISIVGNFIFGDKAETPQSVKETLDYWKANVQTGINFSYINPYPGTELYYHCLKRGIIKDKLDFIENHIVDVFNMTDTMTDEEFRRMAEDIADCVRFRIYAFPLRIRKNSDGKTSFTIKCPHCNEVVRYNNYVGITLTSEIITFCRHCRRRVWLVSRFRYYSVLLRHMVHSLMGPKLRRKLSVVRNMVQKRFRFLVAKIRV